MLETVGSAAGGRASVIAHVGALDTATMQRLAARAAGLGVAAVAAVPPVYFRVDDDALFEHYRLIAEAAAGTPVRGIKNSSYNLFDMSNIIELAPRQLQALGVPGAAQQRVILLSGWLPTDGISEVDLLVVRSAWVMCEQCGAQLGLECCRVVAQGAPRTERSRIQVADD